jgi:hypothetical protein
MDHGEHGREQHGHHQHKLAVPPDRHRWAALVLLCLGVVERRMTARLMRPQMLARRPVLGGSVGVAVMSTVAASSITGTGPDVGGFAAGYLAVAAGTAAVIALGLPPRAGRLSASATDTGTKRLGRPERIQSCRSPSCSTRE